VIAVSSDSEQILNVAREYGANILVRRPDEMATDSAAKLPVIRHCVAAAEQVSGNVFDVCVDLDATSPLRSVDDINQAVALLESAGAGNVVTAMPARRSPYFNLVELSNEGVPHLSKALDRPVVRRQDAPACFDMNASIYVWTHETLFSDCGLFNPNTRLYVMPEERSIDIDSENDFVFVEVLMQQTMARDKGN
jgi:CMP-N,N'-diacetyllegionaminic acid synthase